MYWFSHPPYLRYGAALLLIVIAAWVELRPVATAQHPFAVVPVAAGSPLDPASFELRQVPPGLFESVTIVGTARRPVDAGAPLLAGDIDPEGVTIPAGWWTVEVPLPVDTQRGDEVRIVVRATDPEGSPSIVDGLAVRIPPPTSDPFGFDGTNGLVAIPGEQAAAVATAAGDRRITILVRSPVGG